MGSEYLGFVLFAVNVIALIWMHYYDKVKRALIVEEFESRTEMETENNKVEIFKLKQRLENLEDKILMNDARVFIEKQKQDIRILDKQINDAYKDMQDSITKYNEIRDEFIEKQKQYENIEFWCPNFKNKNK